jgi:hypothetical protein
MQLEVLGLGRTSPRTNEAKFGKRQRFTNTERARTSRGKLAMLSMDDVALIILDTLFTSTTTKHKNNLQVQRNVKELREISRS